MEWWAIFLFFIYTYGIGATATSVVKNSENFLERTIMRVGIGLAILPLLILILNALQVPMEWWIVLALSLVWPIYNTIKHPPSFKIKVTKSDLYVFGAIALFAINLYIYASGAFVYPYLENDDPYGHIVGVKYMSTEKDVYGEGTKWIRYVNPYPPAYNIVMGLIDQTAESTSWALKFFNALIISLATLFFYFFVKELTGVRLKALFAALFLVAIPSFLSHFIWAIAYAVPMYFVIFYCLERIKHDKRWWMVAAVAMVGPLLATPSHSTYLALFISFYIVCQAIIHKQLIPHALKAAVVGASLCIVLWWIPMIMLYGSVSEVLTKFGLGEADLLSIGGTGDRPYTFATLFAVPMGNMINNPVGIGQMLTLLFAIGLVFILIRNFNQLRKHLIPIAGLAVATTSIIITFLFNTYAAEIWPTPEYLATLDISFGEFFSDQLFLIFFFSLFASIAIALAYVQWKDKLKHSYLIFVTGLLAITFYSVYAAVYFVKLSPFRAWMLLAIPVCIIAAEGIYYLQNIVRRSAGKIAAIVVVWFFLFGIPFIPHDENENVVSNPFMKGVYKTSFIQKEAVNTATWVPGGFWTSNDEIGSYIWMKNNLPINSRVFTFEHYAPIIAMDMYVCHWCEEVRNYRREAGLNETAEQNREWLRRNNYEYVIIDGQTARLPGANVTNKKIQEFAAIGMTPVHQSNGAIIFKV